MIQHYDRTSSHRHDRRDQEDVLSIEQRRNRLYLRLGRLGEVVLGESFPDRGVEFLEDRMHIGVNRWSWGGGYNRFITFICIEKE